MRLNVTCERKRGRRNYDKLTGLMVFKVNGTFEGRQRNVIFINNADVIMTILLSTANTRRISLALMYRECIYVNVRLGGEQGRKCGGGYTPRYMFQLVFK